jgi:hypothetical protein
MSLALLIPGSGWILSAEPPTLIETHAPTPHDRKELKGSASHYLCEWMK